MKDGDLANSEIAPLTINSYVLKNNKSTIKSHKTIYLLV